MLGLVFLFDEGYFKCKYTILTGLDVMYNKVNHTPIRGVRDFPD